MSKTFFCDDRVGIFNFPETDPLNQQTGTVVGEAGHAYIVLLDNPDVHPQGWKAVAVVPACLVRI